MELKITEEKENKLFNRKEIKGFVESNVTPSRPNVTKLLSEKFSVPSENIKIKKIMGKFGARIFDIGANIYSSREEKDSIELKKKKDIETEKKTKEAEKPEPVEARESPAEKPAEESQSQPEQKEKTEQEQEKKPEETKEKNLEEKKEENKPESQ